MKANVLFFDRKPGSDTPGTKELWIYELRTNLQFTLKANPLRRAGHESSCGGESDLSAPDPKD